ncbi:hypothetical protein PV08_09725 [Exophiala spinifera]|uniref:GST N-terminal domain-containing protein n=1 Tax=Exophiala spinifera TaxID=91928 RepID=A0A0D2B0I8_9EURO|nr:uncharacterized protein PV08_09725 [Exophiala spinifera]KIW12448.1 hypothetical protein PV08_09725 [Exophiala spinifera]
MTESSPEIVLYDLACTKNVCFSPAVLRTRLMLNYKHVAYETIFLEFPDIEQTLKELGVAPHDTRSDSEPRYTVPAIHHVPSSTYLMDSHAIAEFLESTYPTPPLTLVSSFINQVSCKARSALGPAFRSSVTPREIRILPPRSQVYFRQKREALLGHRLEDLLDLDREERTWNDLADEIRAAGEFMLTNKANGPFVLGAQPSYTDFFIAGSLHSARMVDEGIFERCTKFPGYKEIYEACRPYMDKMD